MALEDPFKLLKCEVLLNKAQKESFASAEPLIKKCETLLNSISSDYSHDKEKVLTKIAQLYAQYQENYSYNMALQFSSSDAIFSVATSIQNTCASSTNTKIFDLFSKAYNKNQEDPLSKCTQFTASIQIHSMLKYVKAFALVKENKESKTFSLELRKKTLNLVEGISDVREKLKMFCQIVECYKEMKEPEGINNLELEQLLNDASIPLPDRIEARLKLANFFLSFKNFETMNIHLEKVKDLIQKNSSLIGFKNLYSLLKLISTIKKNPSSSSYLKNWSWESLISDFPSADADKDAPLSDEDVAETYLGIATFCVEELGQVPENNTKKEKYLKAINAILEKMKSLPVNTAKDLNFKIDLFMRLSDLFKKNPNLKMIEKPESIVHEFYRAYSACSYEEQLILISKIEMLSNKLGLDNLPASFLEIHLSYIQRIMEENQDQKIANGIDRLVKYYLHVVQNEFVQGNTSQVMHLQWAEKLLTCIRSPYLYKQALASVIQGYLSDPHYQNQVKGEKLLQEYENQPAKSHLINGVAISIFMGLVHLYPQAGPLLSLGTCAFRVMYEVL